MKTLDMRGKVCPIPVVEARKALEQEDCDAITLLVDNELAVQNLEKMAKGKGYAFRCAERGEGIHAVTLEKGGSRAAEDAPAPTPAVHKPTSVAQVLATAAQAAPPGAATILISKDHLGEGAEELGRILLKGYLFTLTELPEPPERLLLINGGVRLACEGSNALADLTALRDKGTRIGVCGTCLNFYGLTEALAVGEVVNMMDISQALMDAARLITL